VAGLQQTFISNSNRLSSCRHTRSTWAFEEFEMRILIVEDEPDMAVLIHRRLGRAGFESDRAGSIGEAMEALRANSYSLVLLDRRLPDGDGAKSIPALREMRPNVPIVIVSALDAYSDRVTGLDAGADDYIAKPFNGPEFLARIRARLRPVGGRPMPPIMVGKLSYDANARQIMKDAAPLPLHRREFALLEALMRRANRVATRAELTSVVYGLDTAVSPGALDTLVSRVRKRLEDADANTEIHLVRGRGYLLTETSA
jgi:two-component system OmpR family response regulator